MATLLGKRKRRNLLGKRKRRNFDPDEYDLETSSKYSRGSGLEFQNAPQQAGAGQGVNVLNDDHVQSLLDPFDIFGLPVINDDYERFEDHYIEPTQEPTDTGPIVFKFKTQGGERFDSSFAEIETEHEIINVNTKVKTTGADDIAVINSFPITSYDKIEVKINDEVVTNSSAGNHAFHAYFQQKFSYNKAVKKEILRKTEYYFEEEPDKVDSYALDPDVTKNDHYKEKHNIFVSGTKSVKSRTQFYLDVFNVHKLFPTDLDFTITLTRNPNAFCLMGTDGDENFYKIKINKIRLVLRKIIPNSKIVSLEEKIFNSGKKAYIPYSHGIITNHLMEKGNVTKKFIDVCLDKTLPKKMFVWFVDHEAMSGKMHRNPFEWKNYNLQRIQFFVEGRPHPIIPYDFDFNNDDVKQGYMELLNALGVGRSNKHINLTVEMYKKYCSVFVLDLHADQCNTDHIHFQKDGSVDVQLMFREPLRRTINVCCLAYHDYCLTFQRVPEKHKTLVTKEPINKLLAGE